MMRVHCPQTIQIPKSIVSIEFPRVLIFNLLCVVLSSYLGGRLHVYFPPTNI